MKLTHLFPALSTATSLAQTIDLSTLKWTLSSPTYTNITVPGSVPSQVHLDLYREGVIPDPYFGLGDFELRWVTYGNWTYETVLEGL
jgi:beta-mannosidase